MYSVYLELFVLCICIFYLVTVYPLGFSEKSDVQTYQQ